MTALSPDDLLQPGLPEEEVCFLGIEELARRLDARELSAVELTRTHLQRIERVNPQLNAYVTVLAEQALEAAAQSDRRRSSGAGIGELDGIPVSVKDVEPMAGVRFTMGLRALSGNVSTEDPVHVKNLRAAGAVILGKTNTPELGHKGITDNLLFGPTKTPYSLRHNAGGSSGGGAAATAAGLAVASQGSDGGGSLRIPAAMSGVVGFKGSAFSVPEVRRPDAFQAALPFQHIGALTRSVADVRRVQRVLARPDGRDPLHRPVALESEAPVAGLRIGYDPRFGDFPVQSEVLAVIGEAVERISADRMLAAALEPLRCGIGDPLDLARLWVRLMSVQAADGAEQLLRRGVDLLADPGGIPPEVVQLIQTGRAMSALEHRADSAARTVVFDALEDAFARVDLLITPTLAVAGVVNGEFGRTVGPRELDGRKVEPTIGWTLTYPVNFSGHPAISIPAGLTSEGLPVGLQLIGRQGADALLLSVSEAVERILAR